MVNMARRLTDTYWVEAEIVVTIDRGCGVIEKDIKSLAKMIIIVPPEIDDLLSVFIFEAQRSTKNIKGLIYYRDIVILDVRPL